MSIGRFLNLSLAGHSRGKLRGKLKWFMSYSICPESRNTYELLAEQTVCPHAALSLSLLS